MIPVVTAEEMRRLDDLTILDFVPGLTLMERAGKGVRDEIIKRWKPGRCPRVVVVCGKGNNGGDGFVVSRLLKKDGYRVTAYVVGKVSEVKGDAQVNLKRCQRAGVRPKELAQDSLVGFERDLKAAHVIVDALFGTGFEGKPKGLAAHAIASINGAAAPRVSIDIPSGVDATTGEAQEAVKADVTVTMGLPKRGHLLFPGKEMTGDLAVVDIGIPPEVISR